MGTKPTTSVQYYDSTASVWRTAPAGTVQRLSWSAGRQNITDQFQGGTCTVYGRLPSTLPSVPQVGAPVDISVTSNGQLVRWGGYVSDYRVIYGTMPVYDTFELQMEGAFSAAARQVGTLSTTAGNSTGQVFESLNSLTGGKFQNGGGFNSTTSAQTFDGQFSNPAQVAIATDGGLIIEQRNQFVLTQPLVVASGRNASSFGQYISAVFSDDLTATTATIGVTTYNLCRFTEIEFLSAAYNLGTKVTVQAEGLAEQSSGAGIYAQTVSTISQTTTQAADLAGYLRTKYEVSAQVPYAIRFSGAVQTYPYDIALNAADQSRIGSSVVVYFRGSTYNCITEGIQLDVTPTDWSCTLALSSSLQNAFLRLDDPIYGTLDNNKLGF